jgi:hypothetical protein
LRSYGHAGTIGFILRLWEINEIVGFFCSACYQDEGWLACAGLLSAKINRCPVTLGSTEGAPVTGILVLLYIAIGVGCGLIRLSAVAVGIIAMIPAGVGAFAVSSNGVMSIVAAILVPLLVIEGVYFLTMLVVGKLTVGKPVSGTADAAKPAAQDIPLGQKSRLGKEP